MKVYVKAIIKSVAPDSLIDYPPYLEIIPPVNSETPTWLLTPSTVCIHPLPCASRWSYRIYTRSFTAKFLPEKQKTSKNLKETVMCNSWPCQNSIF